MAADEALAWMRRAEQDLRVARDLATHGHWEAVAFHAQQAAEKALKGVQILRLARFDRIHDLVRLAKSVSGPGDVLGAAAYLSQFYTAARYPEDAAVVTKADAERALEEARKVLAWTTTQK